MVYGIRSLKCIKVPWTHEYQKPYRMVPQVFDSWKPLRWVLPRAFFRELLVAAFCSPAAAWEPYRLLMPQMSSQERLGVLKGYPVHAPSGYEVHVASLGIRKFRQSACTLSTFSARIRADTETAPPKPGRKTLRSNLDISHSPR